MIYRVALLALVCASVSAQNLWLNEDLLSWGDASDVCDELGGHLVTIGDAIRNAEVAALNPDISWIGLNDGTTEGTFVWEDGSPVNYTNWSSGQPDDFGDEDCVEIYGVNTLYNEAWNDLSCSALHASVCDLPVLPGVCPFDNNDGNLEVRFPPLLDENNTHVEFVGTDAFFQIRILVPTQYETAAFDFEGAANDGAAFDSSTDDINTSLYWSVDTEEDPCNYIYTASIPWDLFRTSLGGIVPERYSDEVTYSTTINIETNKTLTVTPETLLEESSGKELAQIDPIQHTRTVRNKIPFQITFDLEIDLDQTVYIESSPNLRVTAALLETSLLEIERGDDTSPAFARARLELVTTVPLPLELNDSSVIVSDPLLAFGLSIYEVARNCDVDATHCTQFWQIDFYPYKCTLDGQFNVTVTADCHDLRQGCESPSPNSALIVMDVRSDNFCGVTQEVNVVGDLTVYPTECNSRLEALVEVESPEGAAINHTEVIKVRAYPTLENPDFTTIYDRDAFVSNLSFATTPAQNTATFSFQWEGASLRCDVRAEIEVVVQVEYQATRDLGTKLLSFGGRSSGNNALLQASSSDQRVIMAGSAQVSPDRSNTADGDGNATSALGSSAAMIGVAASLAGLLVIALIGGAFYVRRLRQKAAGGYDASGDVEMQA